MRTWLQAPVVEDRRSGSRALTAALAVVAAALGYAMHLAASHVVDTAPIPAPASSAPAHAKAVAIDVPEVAALAAAELPETTGRPIFFADRRIPEPDRIEAAPAAAPADAPSPLRLVAIATIGGSSRILVRGGDEPGRWMSIGEEYRGWQLKQVAAETAIVEARGHVAELQLYPQRTAR